MNKMQTKINRSLRQEMNPVPTVSSVGSNPRAAPTAKSRWMRRSVRVRVNATASSDSNVSFADIGTAMGAVGTETYTVKVLGVRSWNVTPLATTDNYISAELGLAVTVNNAPISAEDYGCGMQLPGVKINVPDLLSASNPTSIAGGNAFKILASATTQKYLVDFDLMYQM